MNLSLCQDYTSELRVSKKLGKFASEMKRPDITGCKTPCTETGYMKELIRWKFKKWIF